MLNEMQGNVDLLKPNTLVRYRGMVSDLSDPEYYLGVYNKNNVCLKLLSCRVVTFT